MLQQIDITFIFGEMIVLYFCSSSLFINKNKKKYFCKAGEIVLYKKILLQKPTYNYEQFNF